jgi:Ni/Fe-hydrogenase subunit HybB-like protein
MAIRDQLRSNAAPYLEDGEKIEAVFTAQTTSQWFALISFWIIVFKNAYRVVIVTDRRILVARSARLRTTPVKEIVATLPRQTRIGPATGAMWYHTDALGPKLYIHRRWFKDIEAADGAA